MQKPKLVAVELPNSRFVVQLPRRGEEPRRSWRRALHDVSLPEAAVEEHPHDQRHRAAQRRIPPASETQGSLPSEDAALVLLFGLIATGQVKLSKIDGYKKLAAVISEQTRRAA